MEQVVAASPPRPRTAAWQESVVAHATDGVLLVGSGGVIRYFNRAAEKIFRCTAAEAIGSDVGRFIPHRFRGDHDEHIRGSLTYGHSAEMADRRPVPALRADGDEFFADIALVSVLVPGAGLSAACTIRDVTERMRIEAAMLQSEKLESLRMLSAGLAHDFNNILAAVLGNAEIAMSYINDDSPAFLSLHDIRDAGRRAADMVTQMLRFAGQVETPREPVDLNQVVVEMTRILRSSLHEAVRTVLNLHPDAPPVQCDQTGMRQVLMNLVLNANDAMGEAGGTVQVGTSVASVSRHLLSTCITSPGAVPGEYFCLEVADTGPGMDPETRAHVFDPFFTTRFPGRGLGLASVLGIVRAHSGAIRLSTRPGKGTTFRIFLPMRADRRT